MPASSFYEVRCENCRTTVPPETKRCIHCGGPLGESPLRWVALGGAPPSAAEDEDTGPVVTSRARTLLWGFTAVLALLMSVLRHCAQS